MRPAPLPRRTVLALPAVGLLGGAAGCSASGAAVPGDGRGEFPALPDGLGPLRSRILEIAREEHAAPRPGTAGAQGVEEAWCADFVSWVYRAAGAALTNPHSGGWRIPGVQTLREHLHAEGRWHPTGSGYLPQPGDLALYDHSSELGEHTNIVVRRSGRSFVTVGGNEAGKVRVGERSADQQGVLGYGRPARSAG